MTTSTPTPCTITQPLPAAAALGPGIEAEALRKGLKALASREDVHALVAFGSRACGGARPDSDLDLLVIGREARIEPEEQIQRWQELRTALGDGGVLVDLLVYGQEEAVLLGLQPFAVKARNSAEDTPLPGERLVLRKEIEALTCSLETRLLPGGRR